MSPAKCNRQRKRCRWAKGPSIGNEQYNPTLHLVVRHSTQEGAGPVLKPTPSNSYEGARSSAGFNVKR